MLIHILASERAAVEERLTSRTGLPACSLAQPGVVFDVKHGSEGEACGFVLSSRNHTYP
jgi:hypothetical protein